MTLETRGWDRTRLMQAVVFVLVSTLALTASFLGLVGIFTGGVSGLGDRMPFYVLALAVAFVGAIIILEAEFRDGERILQLAVISAVVAFVVVTLGGEGIAYLAQHPDQVLASDLLFYILAAGLIGTGLAYWAVEHWSEVGKTTEF